MTIHTASCKPELISLGRCMLQGFASGVLAAMALLLLCLIRGLPLASFIVVFWAVVPLVIGGFLGAIKAIPFWTVNCFRQSPLPVLVRIILGGIVPTSLWLFLLIREGHSIRTLGFGLILSNEFQRDYGWYKGEAMALRILCVGLLIAWAIFIPTAKKRLRIDILPATTAIACERDHQCLGSRFAEWQQRAA